MDMRKLEYNPELKNGDRVICIRMDDEYSAVPMGMGGTVKNKVNIFGETQYEVKWDNGSNLSLISGVDRWVKEDDFKNRKKQTDESIVFTITKGELIKENFYRNI
jgi:hypothetical protein